MNALLIAILVLQCLSLVLHALKAPVAVDQVVDGVLEALKGSQPPQA